MPRSAPIALDCNRRLTTLLGIGSIRWFGDLGFIDLFTVAPKVQTLNSPGATPWEIRSPTRNPALKGPNPSLFCPFRARKNWSELPGRCPSLTSHGTFGANQPPNLPDHRRHWLSPNATDPEASGKRATGSESSVRRTYYHLSRNAWRRFGAAVGSHS